mmetsp:Transcript_35828/g.106929  ORF Transcript_35828/g.106929 Transcript_35828/m.106929 type:complete len:213 (+) Transcript_35828:1845-2483(+)
MREKRHAFRVELRLARVEFHPSFDTPPARAYIYILSTVLFRHCHVLPPSCGTDDRSIDRSIALSVSVPAYLYLGDFWLCCILLYISCVCVFFPFLQKLSTFSSFPLLHCHNFSLSHSVSSAYIHPQSRNQSLRENAQTQPYATRRRATAVIARVLENLPAASAISLPIGYALFNPGAVRNAVMPVLASASSSANHEGMWDFSVALASLHGAV